MKPLKLKVLNKKDLFIKWDDEAESKIPLKKLREFCPCALCINARDKQSKMYIPIFNENQILIASLSVVGSYAININWKDGHNTGIYDYPFLRRLAS
jgi:DUF971 family protein